MMAFKRTPTTMISSMLSTYTDLNLHYSGVYALDDDVKEESNEIQVLELPTELLGRILQYLDHTSLHAVELTNTMIRHIVKESRIWYGIGSTKLIRNKYNHLELSWKQITCLAARECQDDKKLLCGVQAFSSADRPSENPMNTLTMSSCLEEFQEIEDVESLNRIYDWHNIPSLQMTIGEHIQVQCGCSTGKSCYWSSSASSNPDAIDYIDYIVRGPCVVESVQIVPYRVFWHPSSPTYAPKQVRFAFYEVEKTIEESSTNDEEIIEERDGLTRATVVANDPFYESGVYPVENDMKLQTFQLPKKVLTTGSTIIRIQLLGRQQAQTFEIPHWLQRTEEDRLPMYYCCLSYVNVVGTPLEPVKTKKMMDLSPSFMLPTSFAAYPFNGYTKLTEIADYMRSCYEELVATAYASSSSIMQGR